MIFITHDLSMLAAVCRAHGGHVRGPHRRAGPAATRSSPSPRTRTRRRSRPRFPDRSATPRSGCIRPACRAIRPTRATCPRAARSTRAARARSESLPVARRRAVAGRRRTARPRACTSRARRCRHERRRRCSRCATCTSSFAADGRRRPGRRRRRPRGCARARSSPWSASRAAARPRWPARSSASQLPDVRRGRWCAASRCATTARALREHRRTAQLVFQDPTGALNPRQTIYEAVAEGAAHPEGRRATRRRSWPRRSSQCGPAPARALLHALPHELSGGQRQRVVIAGRDGARPEPAGRRRARVEPRRLGARRDPRADAAARARDGRERSSSSRTTSGWPGTSRTASR